MVNRSLGKTNFLKRRFGLMVFLIFVIMLPSTCAVYDRFRNKSEVIQYLQLIDQPIVYNGNLLREYVATIVNSGNYDAKNMHVVLSINNGSLLKTEVKTQEQYVVLNSSVLNKPQELFFDNFAPSSTVQVAIWTISPQNEAYDAPQLHTTFFGGVVKSYIMEGRENPGPNITDSPMIIWRTFQERFIQSGMLYEILRKAENYGIYDVNELNLENQEFRQVLATILVLAIPFWLLMTRRWSIIFTGFLASVSLWLFTNVTININWIAIFVFFAFLTLWFAQLRFVQILLLVTSVPMLILYFSSITSIDFECITHAMSITNLLFCSPVSIPVGLVFGYGFLTLYLLITELGSIRLFQHRAH